MLVQSIVLKLPLFSEKNLIALTKFNNKTMDQKIAQFVDKNYEKLFLSRRLVFPQDLCLCERFRGFNSVLNLPLSRENILIALTKFKIKNMHQK